MIAGIRESDIRGEWSANIKYEAGVYVKLDGKIYLSRYKTIGEDPREGKRYAWEKPWQLYTLPLLRKCDEQFSEEVDTYERKTA